MNCFLALFVLGLSVQSIYGLRCFDCTGSCSNPVSVACRQDQYYCYMSTSGGNINAGCASDCRPGSQTQCCSTENCNNPRQGLSCYSCNDCRSGQSIERCNGNQKYCYRDGNTAAVRKGCAERCTPGKQITCCSTPYCNV